MDVVHHSYCIFSISISKRRVALGVIVTKSRKNISTNIQRILITALHEGFILNVSCEEQSQGKIYLQIILEHVLRKSYSCFDRASGKIQEVSTSKG